MKPFFDGNPIQKSHGKKVQKREGQGQFVRGGGVDLAYKGGTPQAASPQRLRRRLRTVTDLNMSPKGRTELSTGASGAK